MNYSTNQSILRTLCLTTLLILIQASSYSQSVWMEQYTGEQTLLGLDAMIPSFEDNVTKAPTSSWFLYGQIPVGDSYAIRADIPISHTSYQGNFINGGTDFGNPYIGISLQSEQLDLDLGIRLPLADEEGKGLLSGMLIDTYRIGAYAPETFTVSGGLNYRYRNESGLLLRLGGGADYFSQKGFDDELFLRYYGLVMYEAESITFGGGLISQMLLTESNLNLKERSLSSLGVSTTYDAGNFKPGISLQLPLDENLSDAYNFVIGLNLAYLF